MTKFTKKWRGKVKDGKLILQDFIGFNKEITLYEGRDVVLNLDSYKLPRSNEQNRYYWGVVLEALSDLTGYTPEEMHEWCKSKWLSYSIDIDGNLQVIAKSTTDLDTLEFTNYIEKIRDFAASNLGEHIPSPEEAKSNNLY